MKSSVTFIVPAWNQAPLLQRLLASVSLQTRKPDEVIVVDNGSTDNAAELAGNWGARVIALGENRGFAAAVNRGIAECSTEWVALINTDVELTAQWLENLLSAAVQTSAWFCCGKLMTSADHSRIDGTWDLIATSGCPLRAGNAQLDSTGFSYRRAIRLASATATLYRRELFKQVGDFDEQFESYLEDVDFSVRCAVLGFAGVYEPSAVAYHVGGASSGRMVYFYARNQALMVRKLFPMELQRKFRSRIFWGRFLWGALALRRGAFGAWVSGIATARRMPVKSLSLDPAKLEALLQDSEREIKSVGGSDRYWRVYFFFTRGGSG